jgi:hypothetical protein
MTEEQPWRVGRRPGDDGWQPAVLAGTGGGWVTLAPCLWSLVGGRST